MIWLLSTALAGGFTPRVEEVEIDAPPEVVWQVLTDLLAYPEWNPWLVEAEGTMAVGRNVRAEVVLGDDQRSANHRVFEVSEPTRLCWHDLGWFTMVAKGQRCRDLTPTPSGGTLYRVELVVNGAASGTVEKKFGASLSEGLAAETAALKRRAEKLAR